MGAKQSKRSVDITTGKEVVVEGSEVAAGAGGEGKLERIEDLDTLKPQLNGDAHQEEQISDKEKKMQEQDEGKENEKDNCNEKEIVLTPVTVNGNGEGEVKEEEKNEEQEVKEKKTKKAKKHKWSFRSISFSRKDKQKPTKKEETNGECEKVTEEGVEAAPVVAEVAEANTESAPEKESPTKEPETPVTEPLTNGNSAPETPKEEVQQNGESASVEEQPSPVEPAVEAKVEETKPEEVEPPKQEEKVEVEEKVPSVEVPAVNGMKAEEQAPEETKPPVEEVAVPKEEKSEIIGDSEVCSEKESSEVGSVEVVPPPLPSCPPPSSLTIFAESTMAPLADPQIVDTSLPTLIPDAHSQTESEPLVQSSLGESNTVETQESIKPEEPEKVEEPIVNKVVKEVSLEAESVAVVSTVNIPVELPTSDKIPEPVEPTIPEPIESAIPESIESVIPEPIESTKPEPIESVIPEPIESTIPEPIESVIPEPIESTILEPVESAPVLNVSEPESKPDIPIPETDASVTEEHISNDKVQSELPQEITLENELLNSSSVPEVQQEVIVDTSENNPTFEVENVNLPSPVDEQNISNDSPILQRAPSDLDVSETMPPSDSFPPPPPPESCPDSITETSVSESLPPPMSDFSVPDAALNSPTSETVDLPDKDEVVTNGAVESKDIHENGHPDGEVNGFALGDSPTTELNKVPEQATVEIPQVKTVSDVTEAPAPVESSPTESVPSGDTAAE